MMLWAAFVTQEITSSQPSAHLTNKPRHCQPGTNASETVFPVSLSYSLWVFSCESPTPTLPQPRPCPSQPRLHAVGSPRVAVKLSHLVLSLWSLELCWWLDGKESTCQCTRPGFDPWVRKIPWRRELLPTPVFLPGKSHGQRRLVDYRPWGCKRVRHDLTTNQQLWPLGLYFFFNRV